MLKFFVGILVLDSFVLLLGGSLLRCYLLATEERYLVPGSAASLVGSSHNPSIVHHNIHPIHHNTMGPLPYIEELDDRLRLQWLLIMDGVVMNGLPVVMHTLNGIAHEPLEIERRPFSSGPAFASCHLHAYI